MDSHDCSKSLVVCSERQLLPKTGHMVFGSIQLKLLTDAVPSVNNLSCDKASLVEVEDSIEDEDYHYQKTMVSLGKGQSVTMRLGTYRAVSVHAQAISSEQCVECTTNKL